MGSKCQIGPSIKIHFTKCVLCFLLQPQKLIGSTNPFLEIDGFGRTHRTHANATTAWDVPTKQVLPSFLETYCLPHHRNANTLVHRRFFQIGIESQWNHHKVLMKHHSWYCFSYLGPNMITLYSKLLLHLDL